MIEEERNHLGKKLKQGKIGGKDCEKLLFIQVWVEMPNIITNIIIGTTIINEFNAKAGGIIDSISM